MHTRRLQLRAGVPVVTETPGPGHARDRARVDVRPVAESRHELDA